MCLCVLYVWRIYHTYYGKCNINALIDSLVYIYILYMWVTATGQHILLVADPRDSTAQDARKYQRKHLNADKYASRYENPLPLVFHEVLELIQTSGAVNDTQLNHTLDVAIGLQLCVALCLMVTVLRCRLHATGLRYSQRLGQIGPTDAHLGQQPERMVRRFVIIARV